MQRLPPRIQQHLQTAQVRLSNRHYDGNRKDRKVRFKRCVFSKQHPRVFYTVEPGSAARVPLGILDGAKTICTLRAAHTYMAYIREYPPRALRTPVYNR